MTSDLGAGQGRGLEAECRRRCRCRRRRSRRRHGAPSRKSACRGRRASTDRAGDPSASAMRCTIESPRPKPPTAGRSVADPRWNSSKIISRSASPMPGPVSHTSMRTSAPAPARQETDAAPRGVLHRVDHEVLQDTAEHQRIGNDGSRCGARSSTGLWRAPAARYRARWRRSARRAARDASAGVNTPASSLEISRMDSAALRWSSARARCARR